MFSRAAEDLVVCAALLCAEVVYDGARLEEVLVDLDDVLWCEVVCCEVLYEFVWYFCRCAELLFELFGYCAVWECCGVVGLCLSLVCPLVAEEEWVHFDCYEVQHDKGSGASSVAPLCIFHGCESVAGDVEETVIIVTLVYRFSDGVCSIFPFWLDSPFLVQECELGCVWCHPCYVRVG